jgi:hypothetical protein
MPTILDYILPTQEHALEVKHCPVCSIQYAAPKAMFERLRKNGGDWFCPNGHNIRYVENECAKLKKELEREKSDKEWYAKRNESLINELKVATHRERGQRAAKTKLKNKLKNGGQQNP